MIMTARIVVGIDGSEESRRALQWACKEAALRDAALEVVHAYSAPWEYWAVPVPPVPLTEVESAQRRLLETEVAAVLGDQQQTRVEHVLINDLPARALIEQGKGADLLVLGTRGKGGFAGVLLGSVSQHVVHHAPCPVVIVPTTHK
jgi:nucleotide-binding universal stress UspA family protein